MIKANFVTAEEAAASIEDGSTVATIAMTLVSASESNLKAIECRFLETGHPRDITLLHSCGQSDRERGIQHFAHEGLVKRIIGSHWGLQPSWMDMIDKFQVEAYCLPKGQIAQLFSSMA
ncbi:MAG: acyl CoA:acetate/3-ketoacid CoA transferase, partial [Collinsella intestinalis]|nr:acyl CoA:acetate/3-ketoacid CoA transferase [Collinsella intestinalis]